MTVDPRGRWFRVYARQVRQHPKFRGLSLSELGAWLVIRSEAEILDAPLADRDEAIEVLRRHRGRPSHLDRLIEVRLLDVLEDGRIEIHDRDDHDRQKAPSDKPESTRQRKAQERSRKVTTRDASVTTPTRARAHLQAGSASVSNSEGGGGGLPAEDDSATLACRMMFDGGKWLGKPEYVAGWDDMDHRYTQAWVQEELPTAYSEIAAGGDGKVLPWDLKRLVELRCAERQRADDQRRDDERIAAELAESDALRAKAESATDEEKERASIARRAVSLWLKKRPTEPIPDSFDDLRGWLEQNGATA
jgi:hypothetical protein